MLRVAAVSGVAAVDAAQLAVGREHLRAAYVAQDGLVSRGRPLTLRRLRGSCHSNYPRSQADRRGLAARPRSPSPERRWNAFPGPD